MAFLVFSTLLRVKCQTPGSFIKDHLSHGPYFLTTSIFLGNVSQSLHYPCLRGRDRVNLIIEIIARCINAVR